MSDRIRICDIAQELGLSSATVSNVLHGKTHKVSDRTVQRVQQALEERNYIPSMAGILLAQNSSRIIGIVIHDHPKYAGQPLADPFIAAALNHLAREIEADGQFMMVKTTADAAQIIPFASMWNLDGLVLLGFCDADYAWLRSHMRIPFVVYDANCPQPPGVCDITIDDYDGGLQVGRHFRQQRHRRVLCLADNDTCVDKARWEGFRAGFGSGADFWMIPMEQPQRHAFYRQRRTQLCQYTAVFAVSDHYAMDLMQVLHGWGLRIPEDMAVAGFDDTPMCRQIWPQLTSVRQDVAQRARIAVRTLRQLRNHETVPSPICLPVQLVCRSSSLTVRE